MTTFSKVKYIRTFLDILALRKKSLMFDSLFQSENSWLMKNHSLFLIPFPVKCDAHFIDIAVALYIRIKCFAKYWIRNFFCQVLDIDLNIDVVLVKRAGYKVFCVGRDMQGLLLIPLIPQGLTGYLEGQFK